MKASAPGKLNVTLACSSPDERGYHPLRTVFMAVGLREEVEVIPADRWSLQTTMVDSAGNEMPLPAELSALAPQENLAVRAASALLQKAGIRGAAQLRITKRVPVAGGRAGGSADAAAALVATAATFAIDQDYSDLARQLGADVPFALAGNVALGTGYGDRLQPIGQAAARHWVFASAAGQGLSTPTVFRRFDMMGQPHTPPWALPGTAAGPLEEQLASALADPDPRPLGQLMFNDLQPAALAERPALAQVIEVARDSGALGAQVSGSGPTVVALAENGEQARKIGSALESLPQVGRVVVITGPAGGARIERE